MPLRNVTREKTGVLATPDDDNWSWRSCLMAHANRLWPRIRLLSPPIVGALIISPFVLQRQLRHWISREPFFAYIHFFLFYFPSPLPAGAFLERSLLSLLFVAIGTGIALVSICGCIWLDGEGAPAYSSAGSRAIGVCTLIVLCFGSGTLSSYAPRLKGPCRALLFSTIWELTDQYNRISARIFLDNFQPALVAMVIGIFCNFAVFPRTARGISIGQLSELLDGTQRLMLAAVEDFFETTKRGNTSSTQRSTFRKLKDDLESLQSRLESNLDAAKYELAYTRVPIGQLQVFLPILRDVRAWFSCSLACLTEKTFPSDEPTSSPGHPPARSSASHTLGVSAASDAPRSAFDFEDAIRTFSAEVSSSITCIGWSVKICTGSGSLLGSGNKMGIDNPHLALSEQKEKIRSSIRVLKAVLNDAIKGSHSEIVSHPVLEPTDKSPDPPDSSASNQQFHSAPVLGDLFRTESYQIAFLMVALLEVALLVDSCLTCALAVAHTWQTHPHRHLHMPAAKWRYWLGRTGLGTHDEHALADERVDALLHEDEPPSPGSDALSEEEVDFFDNPSEAVLAPIPSKLERTPSRVSSGMARARSKIRAVKRVLYTRRAMHYRFALSKAIKAVRHSRHIKFGLKLAAGIVLLTLPSWLPPGHGKQWWLAHRGQWMAISYMFCLETSTGSSFRTSLFRILGTISGSLLGLIIFEISQGNLYALAFLLTLATLPPSYLMLFTDYQGLGIVMGLTLPIVSIIPTQDAGQESAVYVAWNRGYMIFLGIVAALLVNLFIWPLHARLELVKRVSSITTQLQSLYLSLSRQLLHAGLTSSHKSAAAFVALEVSIQSRILQARGLVDIMSMEISLKPKRTKVLSELLNHLETILELLMGLRRCREHGLRAVRREAIVNVLELRQELIAAVLLVLWTTGRALETKRALPQCLPSPRVALEELTEAVAEELKKMVEGVDESPHAHAERASSGVPDAFHALDSLNKTSILDSVRRRNRKRPGLHLSLSGHITPSRPSGIDTPGSSRAGRKRSLDYAMFFILAEHTLLEEMVSSLERLLELCRSMVGEASFVRTEFVPTLQTPGERTPAMYHTAVDEEAPATPRVAQHILGQSSPTIRGRPLATPEVAARGASPMARPHSLGPSPLGTQQNP